MAAVYSNPLNLFNLTVKSTPVGADIIPIGDSAVTGFPLKQCLISSLPSPTIKLTINTQNANYNVVAADTGKVLFFNSTSNVSPTYTLLAPATAGAGWFCYILNASTRGANTLILSPASGNINAQSSFNILPGNSCIVFTDGSNYYTIASQSQSIISTGQSFIIAAMPGTITSTQSTTLTQSQNTVLNSNVVVWPFICPNNALITAAYVDVAVGLAASTVTVGVYADNGLNTQPAAAAALGAVSIATASTGLQTASFGTSFNIYANQVYWCALQISSAVTLSLGNTSMTVCNQPAAGGNIFYSNGTYIQTLSNAYSSGTLPTWTSGSRNNQQYLPYVALRSN
jgi:hypothetical protein